MGEPPQYYEKSDHYYRGRSFHRPPHRARGRGRGDSRAYHVQRTLEELNVTDLRQHIDRIHEQSRSGPPSDPTYNYSKNSPRDHDGFIPKASTSLQRSNSGRGRGRPKNQDSFIQNPMNIQVHFSTSTGERNYTVDEDSKLADIRHVPDYQLPRGRGSFTRGRTIRLRGRGRNIGEQADEEQRVRAKSVERRRHDQRGSQVRSRSVEYRHRDGDGESSEGHFRGRGRGSTSNYSEYNRDGDGESSEGHFRGRGRGSTSNYSEYNRSRYPSEVLRGRGRFSDGEYRSRGRGRGRGGGPRRGRGSQQKYENNTEFQSTNCEQTVDENWEDEEVPSNKTDIPDCTSIQNPETNFTEEGGSFDEQDGQYDQPNESYDDPDISNLETSLVEVLTLGENGDTTEATEVNEQKKHLDEIVKENIVVESGENKKRTVRFNLEENEGELKENTGESNHDFDDKKS
ncbi:uncharacterized protein [Diabrotica undecimpunctata]|uniref:uncharacterized protein n=1 Tax=Diabrotica undecimpunctata TaxID=50387 RepID=UPI003B633F0D